MKLLCVFGLILIAIGFSCGNFPEINNIPSTSSFTSAPNPAVSTLPTVRVTSSAVNVISPTQKVSDPPETPTSVPQWAYTHTPLPISWAKFKDPTLHLELRYPGHWIAESNSRYSGEDGFFEILVKPYRILSFDNFLHFCLIDGNRHHYSSPEIYPLILDWDGYLPFEKKNVGYGCIVEYSNQYGETRSDPSILYARNPYFRPQEVIIVLMADQSHFGGILSTLRFIEDPQSPPTVTVENNLEVPTSNPYLPTQPNDSIACAPTPSVSKTTKRHYFGLVVTEYPVANADCDPKNFSYGFQRRLRSIDLTKTPMDYPQPTKSDNVYSYQLGRLEWSRALFPSLVNIIHGDQIVDTLSVHQWGIDGAPLRNLWTWEGHWIAEVNHVVIMDGEILNLSFEVDEIFEWHFMDNKPFYFFRKEDVFGIVYGGRTLPVEYEDVIHGIGCCAPGIFNVYSTPAETWFYALRDGVWYLVSVQLEE